MSRRRCGKTDRMRGKRERKKSGRRGRIMNRSRLRHIRRKSK
jgi:hypothetical protein